VAPSPAPASGASPALGPSVADAPLACPADAALASPIPVPALGRPGWWRGRVFYEVFVRSFADSNGDGIGDLRGLTTHLDQLNDGDPATTTDLGITGIWLMPVAESPSYHGYDVTDERAIEPDYGTLADLRALIAAAHDRGIAVISDLILNHTSDQHPWFVDARTPGSTHDDWYVWSSTDPGYGGPDGQQVWHPAGDRWFYGVFGSALPDLNLRNPAVTAELDDVARYWLTEVGVDGFRLDAIKHLVEDGQKQVHTPETYAWLQAFRSSVESVKPDALLVGEVYDLSVAVARYVPEDVDLAFDFGLAQATIDAIRRGDAGPLVSARMEDAELFGPGETATFLTNHDQDRIASQLREDPAAIRLAASLLLTGGGMPFIYYGEEIGLTGQKPDEQIRTPMPWTGAAPAAGFTTGTPWEALADGWQTRNVAAQTDDPTSIFSTYRTLIRLRADHPALRDGATVPVTASDPAVDASLRTGGGETVAVVANLSDAPVDGASLRLGGAGPLCGTPEATIVYRSDGTTGPSEQIAAPVIDGRGGFPYWILPELPPRSVTVIGLGG
jgi:alpha-amylase